MLFADTQCDDIIFYYPQQKSNSNTEESKILTQPREDGMIQCARGTIEERKTPPKKWTERDLGAKAKIEYILITPPVDPQPDISVQTKAEQEELKGELDTNLFS